MVYVWVLTFWLTLPDGSEGVSNVRVPFATVADCEADAVDRIAAGARQGYKNIEHECRQRLVTGAK